jgi:N-acetylmuramoyl-L-alanine amidase
MSKIIENFLVPLFLVISVLYAFHSFGADDIVLNKAFHHMADNDGYLEKANISLYFSGDPHVQEIKNKKANSSSVSFFFPNAAISSGECEAMVNRINSHNGNNYKVTIAQITKPNRGIMVRFDCDPNAYIINCEQFDSIGLQKGFVFRLYNKELLDKLQQANNQPVLKTLWHSSFDLYGVPSVLRPSFAKASKGRQESDIALAMSDQDEREQSWGKKRPKVIIDPGHGGRDTGAIGHNSIQEKQVCLSIGTTVGNLLEKSGCSVMLTRNNDCDMQLDERTSFANNNNADLFVSIHANYAASPKAIGVETFCMQQTLFKKMCSNFSQQEDRCVANVMSQRLQNSYTLAQAVQQHVCTAVVPFHNELIDRKVKHSVSQVLLGVQVPAILIEVGFLSHSKEAALLQSVDYQNCIARGICNGILSALSF